MSRSASSSPRSRPRKPRAKVAHSPSPDVLDPNVDSTIQKMIVRFMLRTGLLFFIVSVAATYLPLALHLPQDFAKYALFVAAFGVMIPFWRGIARIFDQVLQMGKEKVAARRYADAKCALEYFHKIGNMGFDLEGEGHYYLILAYLGLHEVEKAEAMAVWLKKHRKRYPWAEKAQTAIEADRRKLERRQVPPATTDNAT